MNDQTRDILLVLAALGVGYFLYKEGKQKLAVSSAVAVQKSLNTASTTTTTTTTDATNTSFAASNYQQFGSPDGSQ